MIQRYQLSIDPASYSCGLAVWTEAGHYVQSNVFKSNASETFRRYYDLREQIWTWLHQLFGDDFVITTCIIEQIPKLVTNNPALPFAASALLTHKKNVSPLGESHMVAPQSWKYVAKMLGADEKPKGILALNQMGWTWKTPANDDEADAILIYIGHALLNGKTIFFSQTDARRLQKGSQQ